MKINWSQVAATVVVAFVLSEVVKRMLAGKATAATPAPESTVGGWTFTGGWGA